ncbi:MAG TPA: protein kinase [Candidatus Acidoferrum sp.]|nr:protein kinase [Candidatus Acidoferrum sp.]
MAQPLPSHGGTISHYRVLEKIGEGGMGVIYKAQDTRLERVVALKVVRDFAADATARRRLWQEARAAAQLGHPNACRIYDVIEEDQRLVLVMEFIEGESLARRLERGPLPAQEAAQVVLGILSALEAFHKKEIVHRDLKPENIVLGSGGPKVLDFGIAKCAPALASADADATMAERGASETLPGIFLGTPKYASPEQFRGLPVDGRADLFSLGAVFYEMLTGQTPFPGTSFAEISHAVLHSSLPALSGSPAIAAMGRIVHRALAREPHDRYANAAAMAADVRAALLMEGIEAPLAHAVRRLIVLPFRMLRPDPDTQFLAYSLPEAITISLAGLGNLVVRSSIVASRYSAETADLQAIAREAEVDVVLTGAILTVGEQLRITTQLAEAPSGTLLWSHSSQATTKELLDLHDDLVGRVVASIVPSLTPHEQKALQRDRSASPTAYQFYLQANELGRHWENLPAATALYERVVQLDPKYAPAWARLGRARWLWDKYNKGSLEGLQSAEEAFQTALRLNPESAQTHNLYTHLQVDQGKTLEALKRLLGRAQQRRTDAELFAGLGHVSRYCGLLAAALAAHEEARRLDPLLATSVMHTHFMKGDYQQALEAATGDYGYGRALALACLGRTEEAVAGLRESELSKPWHLGRLYLTSLRTLLEGKPEESLKASEELRRATFRDPEGMYYLARQLSYLGAQSEALEMLERAVKNGFFCYPAMARDPWLDGLRARGEFTALLREAHERNREASAAFVAAGGDALLGIAAESY